MRLEITCSLFILWLGAVTALIGPLSLCPLGQFECAIDKTCIPEAWRCDGRPDCHDGSDESHETCDKTKRHPWSGAGLPRNFRCRPNQYQCPGTTTCIDIEKVCDAQVDCDKDGADEGYFCTIANCGLETCPHNDKCKETINGALCYCTEGYQYNETTKTCQDVDECSYDGFCDQGCSNSKGSYTCSCYQGYKLSSNQRACTAVNVPPIEKESLLVASADGLRQYKIDGTLQYSFSNRQVQAMDINHWKNTVCWLELGSLPPTAAAILKCNDTRTKQETVIKTEYKLNDVEQFAIDWFTGNWYFTDKIIGRIFICTATGDHCRTIHYTSYPGDIKLDPHMGLMFFTKGGTNPKVARAFMNGGNETVLVNKAITRPRGLTLDLANKHVYWTDTYANYIQRVTYFGKQRTVIMTGKWVDNIFGLSILENVIYATDQQNGSVIVLNRHVHKKITPVTIVSRQLKVPRAIRIFHRQRQPKGPNAVCSNGGGCDHFCIPVYSHQETDTAVAKCECKIGFRLGSDNKTCTATNIPDFLLYSSSRLKLIRGISVKKSDPVDAMPPLVDVNNPGALSFHVAERYVYYCHVHLSQGRIGRRKIDGSMRNDSFISKGIKQCEGLAVDWVANNIYWTDGPLKAISVARLSDPNICKAVITKGLTHPRAIAVDPYSGSMYFADWVKIADGSDGMNHLAKIWRANLDGTNMKPLVNAADPWPLYWPCGLALDLKNRYVYWAEAYYDRIEKISMSGRGTPQMVVPKNPNLKHPLGLALNNDSLYWSEISKIVEFNLTSKVNTSNLRSDAFSYFDLKFFSKESQPVKTSVCATKNGMCSDLCLQSSSSVRTCHCRDGYKFKTGSDTDCEADPAYTHKNGCLPDKEFTCKSNGVCIPIDSQCDGELDCEDGSDEERSQCKNKPCHGEQMHRCHNNRCIYRRWLCDGEDDCRSGQLDDEDPATCANNTCGENYERCNDSGRCYPKEWKCDHDYDCEDRSDEPPSCTEVTCGWDQYRCKNGECIPVTYVCDSDSDCKDGSDEVDCKGKYQCNNETDIICKNDGRCLPKYYQCDGHNNCEDASDEENCDGLVSVDGDDNYWQFPDEFNFDCEESEFKCDDGECIPGVWKCDGQIDCGDGSDESFKNNCTGGTQTCPDDKYGCNTSIGIFTCFDKIDIFCDGIKDCMDNSDETADKCANKTHHCMPWQYDCIGGYPRCVNLTKVCDGHSDCDHGHDEGLFCDKRLCDLNNPCSHTCHNTPDGLRCSCPPRMVLDDDSFTCIEESCGWGVCSQGCKPVRGSKVLCTCNPGYTLEPDGFTCKSNDTTNPYLIFSNRHEMRRLDLKTQAYVSLVSGLANTIALDFHYKRKMLFWTDVVDDQILRGTMMSNTLNNIEPIIKVGLATAEGLAVDWIADNIYWVESHLDQIEVARLDGTMRTTLVAGNMDSPRAIVLDPREGLLFWSDWHSKRPRIERVSMSGKGRTTIVDIRPMHGAGWPNGMTLDYENNRLYWIDARSDSIHTVNYDGHDHRLVLRDHTHLFHPFAITTFGSHVYWTDWKTNSLIRANKWTGTNVEFVDRTITQPFDVHVYHSSRQPVAPNPCDKDNDNGGCSHLCLINAFPPRPGCACPHLMKLQPDNKTCTANDKFLLFAKPNEIRGVDLINADYNVIPSLTLPHISRPAAIDFDTQDGGKIYWTDSEKNVVNRVNLNLTGMETVTDSEIQHPEGFVIDWISRNMYFATYGTDGGKVSVSTLDGAYRVDLHLKGLRLKKPSSLAVHPRQGKLFIAETGTSSPSIYAGSMDGSNMQVLKTSTLAHNLTVDTENDLLFWIDEQTGMINYCNLDGSNLQTVPLNMTAIPAISAMTVYKDDWVYFATNQAIFKVKKNGQSQTMVRNNTAHVNSLKVYDADVRTGENACKTNKGGCAQLCLPTSPTKSVCRCTVGYRLNESDKKSCIGTGSFLMYSTSLAIHGRSLNNFDQVALPPISQISEVSAIDYYAADDYIFWVNNKASTISRVKRDLTERKVIATGGLVGVQGLAVDWAAGNLYWTDQGFGTIEVSRLDGSDRYVVLSNDTDKPGSIVVHPQKGWMIWSDIGVRPRIEIAHLDGSSHQDLVNTTIYRPASISLDITDTGDYLYWCDQHTQTIERIKLGGMKGSERTTIVTNMTNCAAVTVYKDYVYWSEMQTFVNRIKYAKKSDGSNVSTAVQLNGFDVKMRLNDLKIFDKARQATTNVCSKGNGGCQDLCFYLGGGKKTCACSHGRVSANGTTCEDHDEFILYSSISRISGISIMDPENKNAPIEAISHDKLMKNVIGLSFDFESKTIFFSDLQNGNIQSVFTNRTGFKTIVKGAGSAEGLAYNPTFRELYWTSYSNSSINRISLGLRPRATGPNAVAVSENYVGETVVQLEADDHPRSIVIDTCKSLLFWTNWNPKKPSIQRAYTGGWDVRSIITTNIRVPNGLVIDHRAQKLYWSDAGLDKIERCNFDGSNRTVIISVMPQHIFDMALHGNFLYWTDWVARGVMRANKYDGSGIKILRKTERPPMGIVVFAKETNDCTLNPCHINNGGCAGVCNVDEYGKVFCNCTKEGGCGAVEAKCRRDDFRCSNGTCLSMERTCDGIKDCLDNGDESIDYCHHRTCPKHYFRCANSNKCIKWYKRCNRIDDCGDGSDEADCPCPKDYFQCSEKTKHCVLLSHRCDHHPDCPSGEDEIDCGNVNCTTFTYHGHETPSLQKCETTTACISKTWICDGENDCWDNSDEENCTDSHTNKTCGAGNFPCKSDPLTCIPLSWRCDKSPDCVDESDEEDCDFKCEENQMKCGNTTVCIPKDWQCDGVKDCSDGSDEPATCPGSKTCAPEFFTCDNGKCIPDDWRCDGHNDCSKGEDEDINRAECGDVTCGPKDLRCNSGECVPFDFRCDHHHDCRDGSDEGDFCGYKQCQDGSDGRDATEFKCGNGQCIPLNQKCDGNFDCIDLSDETRDLCTKKPCDYKDGKFLCWSGECLNVTLVCDYKTDCSDFSDERYCHMNVCTNARNPCEHTCRAFDTGNYVCECRHGFRLNPDNITCSDIDECKENLPCSHFCDPHNHGGDHNGFKCSCAPGFTLQPDKRSCKVSSKTAPYLLITNRYYIRKVSLEGDSELITKALSNAVALDYDWQGQMIYWSDVTSTGSNISRISLQTNASVTPKPEVLHSSTLRNPDGIALDWLGRNLYWCDKTTDTIEVSAINGKFRKVLVNTGLQEPRALAVHPLRGYLYYTDWGDNAHIGRLGMDGSDRRFIVNQSLGWPNALTVDIITDHIYWADARLDYIKVADLDGKNERIIIAQNLPHIFALTQFGDNLYWTDWEHKSVELAHKFSGKGKRVLTTMIHRPMDLHVIHPSQQPVPKVNPCENNGGCGNLCLIKSGGQGRTCACPENHYLAADDVSCISNCTTSQFKCRDTFKCIPFWNKCDGHDDCGDGSDEGTDCPPYFCPEPNMVQCNDSTKAVYHCIPPSQVCDGINQCRDRSDERNCKQYTCLPNQFKCHKDSRCISLAQRCDGRSDCPSGEDERDCPITSCPATKFRCHNTGRCIPYVWRCDGANDCGDLSDEPPHCKNMSCLPGYFACNSTGQCIPDKWRCDGELDCGTNDKSDEPDECHHATCNPTYFKCSNNRCIPGRWHCDYSNDCGDNSDEKNCTLRSCSESEFKCTNGHCIPHYWRCNGERDCTDGSDEVKCDQECIGKFKCASSNYCIPSSWKCDEEIDCADGSDESGCNKTCNTGEYTCKNNHCIPMSWRCDGTDDCDDNSDEFPGICRNLTCPNRHQCPDGVCILPSQVCDGINHCSDKSDETNCTSGGGCKDDEFECAVTKQCIPKKKVCDTFADCADGTDEHEFLCQHSINKDCGDLKCAYKCTKIGNTPICICPENQQLADDGRSCKEVNQCKLWRTCEQKCVKRQDGHKCSCAEGYINVAVEVDGPPVCKADGNHPYLLMSVENILRSVSLNLGPYGFGVFTEIHKHAKKVEAIDVFVNPDAKDGESNVTVFAATYQPASILMMPFNDKGVVRTKRSVQLGKQPQPLPLEGLLEVRGLAVDWVSRRIYWTDAGQDMIEMANFDGSNRKTIVTTNLDQPHRIVVHPQSRKIYWTDWGINAKIETANLDGSNRTVLVEYDLVWPTGLAIDYPNERIYFADTKKGTIETINLDGSDRHVVKRFKRDEDKPYMVDIFENDLYVTTYKNNDVFKINKYNASEKTYIVQNMPSKARVGHIVVIQEQKQSRKVVNPCSKRLCTGLNTICVNLPYPPPKDHACVCRNGDTRRNDSCIAAPKPKDCPKDLCMNNGTCQRAENNQPKCSCPPRYSGAFCQNDRCYNYCLHNGKCVVNAKLEVSCSCPKEYAGQRCELPKCGKYCHNGGNCTVSPTGQAFCQCPYWYKGPQCQTKKSNLCEDYCLNGGRCHVNGERDEHSNTERPVCMCKDGYAGPRCNQCVGLTCYYNGYCRIDGAGNKSCVCPLGLSSAYQCNETVCKNFCANNGTCKLDDKLRHVCTCPPKFSGPRCREEKCTNFCKNEGICSYDASGQPKCLCGPHYRGTTCDQPIPACYQGFCKNGGTCKIVKNDAGIRPDCICPPGYSGGLCETAPAGCKNFTCENNGVCFQDKHTRMPKCICTASWTGPRCSKPSALQCKHYCFNNGTCTGCTVEKDRVNYKCKECKCVEGWKGPRCADRDFSVGQQTGQLEGSTIAAIMVPILICLIVFTAVAGVCIFRKKYSNKHFHHARLVDNANMEISNPIYRAGMEEETNVDIEQPFDPDRTTNFTNPMYAEGMLFADSGTPVRNEEKKELLHNDQLSASRFDDD